MNYLNDKNEQVNHREKKIQKLDNLDDNNFYIPKYQEFNTFLNKNYKISLLKIICKEYKLKISGNKPDLRNRIYEFLFHTNYAIILQKNVRKFFAQIYFKLMGPALLNRSLSMNSTDFFTLENISSIPYYNFFSYKAKDNYIWSFDIVSFYNLFIKSENNTINPYTRETINYNHFVNIVKLIRLSSILKNPINILINKDAIFSPKKKVELKCLELFQYIDKLGNYTNISWFTNLNKIMLIKLTKELRDIWEYRAQLDTNVKKDICHPYGNPFRHVDMNNLNNLNFIVMQRTVLSIIEQFVKKGISREFCNLGASYILCGLTLVNNDAALAMPWLYQSVSAIE